MSIHDEAGVITPARVIAYWIDEIGPAGWYTSSDALDTQIREQFQGLWFAAKAGDLESWGESAEGALAYLIVTDQMSRNMFRGDAASFATDDLARAMCLSAIAKDFDQSFEGATRQFFYMPLMHSESLEDQDLGVRYFLTRLGADTSNLVHAKAHRHVIAQFGRFPYRNKVLGRETTAKEAAFLEQGGYGFALRQMQEQDVLQDRGEGKS